MLHMAYLNTKSPCPGARLTILGLPLGENDKLVIEYDDEERTSAGIVTLTTDSLVIVVSSIRWRLIRVKLKQDEELASLSRTDDRAITVWEIQPPEDSSL